MKSKYGLCFLGVVLLAAALGAGLSSWVFESPPSWEAWQKLGVYQARPIKVVEPFSLLDQEGNAFTEAQLKGHWQFLFVGYTHCPDVCPTTLSTYRALFKVLENKNMAEAARFIMLTADPERDSPERMKAYLGFFNPQFIGLSGDLNVTRRLAQTLNAGFRLPEHQAGESYYVDHSTHIALVDPEGRFTAFFQPPHEPELMVEVLIRLMEGV